jgi:hypothetical protein
MLRPNTADFFRFSATRRPSQAWNLSNWFSLFIEVSMSRSRSNRQKPAVAGLFLLLLTGATVLGMLDSSPQIPAELPLPRGYVCYQTSAPIHIDGKLDENAWLQAPWTEDFVDIEGSRKPAPRFRTRAKMLWDKQYLYIAAELEEPHVWATLTKHDSVIFQDNDFEVFIDPDGDNHQYAEFEMNALNTGWDLLLTRPYKDGGRPLTSWEIPGLMTAVHVDGTLNDPSDRDRSWTVELAIPWQVLSELARRPGPPRDGEQWRINFSRVEWQIDVADGKYRKVPKRPEDNWVWSPQGAINMHRPETWGYVQFSTAPFGKAIFHPDVDASTKRRLHEIYYAQAAFQKQNKRWARNLSELTSLLSSPVGSPLPSIDAHAFGFTASLASLDKSSPGKSWHIRQDSLLWATPEEEDKP